MTHIDPKKPDLRDRKEPSVTTPEGLDEKFAGDENRRIEPTGSARMVTPDLGAKVPDGQVTKSN